MDKEWRKLNSDQEFVFSEGAKALSSITDFKNNEEWIEQGVLNLKNRVLGSKKVTIIKSLDQLSIDLMELKMLDPFFDGEDFITGLDRKKAQYSEPSLKMFFLKSSRKAYLCFELVENRENYLGLRISKEYKQYAGD